MVCVNLTQTSYVMAGLVPAIHVEVSRNAATWMPATGAGMTVEIQEADSGPLEPGEHR